MKVNIPCCKWTESAVHFSKTHRKSTDTLECPECHRKWVVTLSYDYRYWGGRERKRNKAAPGPHVDIYDQDGFLVRSYLA